MAEPLIWLVPGARIGLLGPNGAGKSTLIKTLAGYHEADPGAVAMPVDLEAAGFVRDERGLRYVGEAAD